MHSYSGFEQNRRPGAPCRAEERRRDRYEDEGRPRGDRRDEDSCDRYRSRSRDQSCSRSRTPTRDFHPYLPAAPRHQRQFDEPGRQQAQNYPPQRQGFAQNRQQGYGQRSPPPQGDYFRRPAPRSFPPRRDFSSFGPNSRPRDFSRPSPSPFDPRIPRAYPALMKTIQSHRFQQERKPIVCGVLPSLRDAEVTEAKLRLKAFLLKLAVDIDTFFLDNHNQISCEGEVVICRTQEPANASEMVAIYHFVVHIEERRNRVHAVDVLQYGTKECPYALRMCYQKNH